MTGGLLSGIDTSLDSVCLFANTLLLSNGADTLGIGSAGGTLTCFLKGLRGKIVLGLVGGLTCTSGAREDLVVSPGEKESLLNSDI